MPIPYPRMGGRQMYTGGPMTTDIFNLTRPTRGQLSPAYQEQWQMQHGRELAGFGAHGGPHGGPGIIGDNRYDGQDLKELEEEDDSVGSGIFDAAGASTVHQTMGVFQDHPAVPGYIARNLPFTVNKDVSDITDGADVVEVPGGGLFYVERGGHLVGPPPGSPPERTPLSVPQRPSGTDQPYVLLGQQAKAPLGGFGHYPNHYPPAQPVPFDTRFQRVPPDVSIVNVANRRVAVGQDPAAPAPAGWGSYLFAGALVGAAAALLMGTVGKKGRY